MPSISLTNPANITSLVFNAISTERLGGSLKSLSQFTSLENFRVIDHDLTGIIPSLDNNTQLVDLRLHSNNLTGSFPSLTNNVNIEHIAAQDNNFTGLSSGFSTNTNLKYIDFSRNQLTEIPEFSENTVIETILLGGNQINDWAGGFVSSSIYKFAANNNLLPQAVVDGLLSAFVSAGRVWSGSPEIKPALLIGGGANAAPSAAGLTNKQTLITRGWTVSTN